MLIRNQKKAKDSAINIIEFSEVDEEHQNGFGRISKKLELHLDDKPRK